MFNVYFLKNIINFENAKERMLVQVLSQQQQVMAVQAQQQQVVVRAAVAQTALAVRRV